MKSLKDGRIYNGRPVSINPDGYAYYYENDSVGTRRTIHIVEWEKHNGPKPPGYEIHHKDENKANYEISNLELVTRLEHRRIHCGWVKQADGSWLKPCKKCGCLLPLSDFYNSTGKSGNGRGVSYWCKSCQRIQGRVWVAKNLEHVRRRARDYARRKRAEIRESGKS